MICSTPAAYQLLQQGSIALAEIEAAGVRVDKEYLDTTTSQITEKIRELEWDLKTDTIYTTWQRIYKNPNLGSRDQLGKVLFGAVGYEAKTFTSTGRAKTDKASLDHVDIPFVKTFLEIENLKKTVSTYLQGIRREMVQVGKHWYVHPSYHLNTVSTYRSSCSEPNFQNVPKRDPKMSKFVRKCYLPHPGHHFAEVDFSTLEVKIAYTYHHDPVMRKYLTDPETDMHRDTAADVFILPQDQIEKKTTRDCSKNMMVFPTFYGSVYFQTAANIWEAITRKKWTLPNGKPLLTHLKEKGITELGDCDPKTLKNNGGKPESGTFAAHIKKVEDLLWKRFRIYHKWRQDYYDLYQKRGWFKFHTGFVVNTEQKRNDVINYPVQGAAFHCLLQCLIWMTKAIKKYKMKSRVIGEIHDSMQLSIHPRELQDVLNLCEMFMTKSLADHWKWINIPLTIEVDVAPINESWAEQTQWVNPGGKWVLKP